MLKNIFKSLDASFAEKIFAEKKNYFFPDQRGRKIKKIKINQVSPFWAKKTCLIKYNLIFEDGSEKIIRGTAKTNFSKEGVWKIMNYLYKNIPAQESPKIPRPLGYLKNINLLLYEEVPGIPLVLALEKENEKIKEKYLKKAAAWLSWLHNLSPLRKKLPKSAFIGSNGYKKTFKKIEKHIPELKKYFPPQKESDSIDKIWQFKKTIIHNDFYPGNSIVNRGDFFGIDFDRAGFGPPLMDVAALFSFFDFPKRIWKNEIPQKEIKKLQNAFLKEYCLINGLSFDETFKKIHPFLIKSFFDQFYYYANFFLEGRRFMNKKTINSFSLIIKDILITLNNEICIKK
ncbi:MAG: aminoglycoside phosphotransferase family protein [Candidatus Nealsonbacteria bacterium]|nr:aminoglycoside phosphotransferase family protein [Candidatus Nealsonbacteria bacterium]